MKLLTGAAALALFLLVLPIALPLGGILFLWDGWPPRRKPAVRPRRRAVREGVAFFGDVVALGTAHDRVMIVRRVRRGERWWAMISTN